MLILIYLIVFKETFFALFKILRLGESPVNPFYDTQEIDVVLEDEVSHREIFFSA